MNIKHTNSINKITVLNILSTVILQGIAFISTPIFTRLLGTSQYGKYSVFHSWVVIISCFMGLGVHSSIGTGMYEFKDDYKHFRNSILLFSIIVGLLECIIIIVFRDFFSFLSTLPSYAVVLVGISALGRYFTNFVHNCFIFEKKAVTNFAVSLIVSLFSIFLSILFVRLSIFEESYIGRAYGNMISCVFIGGITIVWIYFTCPIGIKKKYIVFGVTVGIPIIFHTLAQNILAQSDRLMMNSFGIDSSAIGIYSLFYTLSSVLTLLLNALNNSWCPYYYDELSKGEYDKIKKKTINYIELFSVLSIGFMLVSKEVTILMADRSYLAGVRVMPILVFAVYFTFMYQFPVNFEFFYKKTKIIAIGTLFSGLLNIFLNFILIPSWNMYGAAIATALSYLALFCVHYYIVGHFKNVSFHLKAYIFLPGILSVVISAVLFYLFIDLWIIRWIIAIVVGLFELLRILKRKRIF